MNDLSELQKIIDKDHRYSIDAYLFVLEALFSTRKKERIKGHITGRQLLEGIRDLALQRYGLMTKTVFEHWGVRETIDFGNIVFNMVNEKILGKTEHDRITDFKNIYDFNEVFVNSYKMDVKETEDK